MNEKEKIEETIRELVEIGVLWRLAWEDKHHPYQPDFRFMKRVTVLLEEEFVEKDTIKDALTGAIALALLETKPMRKEVLDSRVDVLMEIISSFFIEKLEEIFQRPGAFTEGMQETVRELAEMGVVEEREKEVYYLTDRFRQRLAVHIMEGGTKKDTPRDMLMKAIAPALLEIKPVREEDNFIKAALLTDAFLIPGTMELFRENRR